MKAIDKILYADNHILFISLRKIRKPFMDRIMKFFSFLGNKGGIWILTCLLMMLFKSTRLRAFTMSAALIFELTFCNLLIKPFAARLRPFENDKNLNIIIEKPMDYSFPSGHTAASFAGAAVIIYFFTVMGIIAYIIAFMIAFSRLYLLVHYPTDVFAGAAIGIICSIFAVHIISLLPFLFFI